MTSETFDRNYHVVDMILIINLAHRKDRREHILNELNRVHVPRHKIQFISAVHDAQNGSVGCTKSHILSLEFAIANKLNNVLILEDDFTIRNVRAWSQGWEFMYKALLSDEPPMPYHVIMLATGKPIRTSASDGPLRRVDSAQTTSAYMVHHSFYEPLLTNFKEGLKHLEKTRQPPRYAIDQYWKHLQGNSSLWFCFSPSLGYQYRSFSDIEKRVVHYGC